jgi:thioredoxin reductase
MNPAAVAIIGAGPSGLALAAVLENYEIPYRMFEKERVSGGTYARIHPDLTLVSPPGFSGLPLALPPSESRPGRLSVGDYRKYLDRYAAEREIRAEFESEVIHVEAEPTGFRLNLKNGETPSFRHVVLATGALSFPRPLEGADRLIAENSGVRFETAAEWRGAEAYRGQTVLILGSGTSATEIATILAPVCTVLLVTKAGFKPYSPVVFGIDSHFLVRPFEFLPNRFLKKFCAPGAKDPTFDFGTRDLIRNGKIRHFTGFKDIRGNIAQFGDGSRARIDVFLNCTGFRFNTDIVTPEVLRNPDGTIAAKKNRSRSHPGLFVLGYPCANHVDSKFIRGIRRDAIGVAKRIRAELRPT